jgi:hypothetical protein
MRNQSMETNYRNKNRGFQQLRVWADAINGLSFKLENGLLRLVERLERK